MQENKLVKNFIVGTFVLLYVMVSIISTIHVIDFFELSNPTWLAITLAIAFEVGAAASLASIIALQKMNKTIVWSLFFILTAMQAMGNAYYAYVHLKNYQPWVELFGLVEEDVIFQKRILSIVSGAILPLVALGFIKSLVDYIKPEDDTVLVETTQSESDDTAEPNVVEKIRKENVEKYIEKIDEAPSDLVENQPQEVVETIQEVTQIIEEDEKKN